LAFGFTLYWEVNISANRAIIELKYYSSSLGKWTLDICHTSAHIHANLETLRKNGSLNVFVNWDKKEIIFKGKSILPQKMRNMIMRHYQIGKSYNLINCLKFLLKFPILFLWSYNNNLH